MTLQEIKNIAYDVDKCAQERYQAIKESAKELMQKAFRKQDFETIKDCQKTLEYLFMQIARDTSEEENVFRVIYITYGQYNKYNAVITRIHGGEDEEKHYEVIAKARISSSENRNELRNDLKFFEKESTF